MIYTIRTDIRITASADRVWSILTDFEGYPAWNPFITKVSGVPASGEKLRIYISPPGREPICISPKIIRYVENKELRWIGRPGGVPCVATGEHYFVLESISPEEVLLEHGERFTGIIVPFLGGIWEKTEEGFTMMNNALKERAESGWNQ